MKDDSWLNPDGKIIEVGKFNHNKYASDLLEEEMGFKELYDYMDKEHIDYPYEVLHKRGWVRIKFSGYAEKLEIFGNCIDLTKPMRNTMNPAMNSKQLKVAKELCKEHNTPFHIAINDKRFW